MGTINTAIRETDYVPMSLWARDHWSTLAYIETKLVEGEYTIRFDPRMRQKRRNFRVLAEALPGHRKHEANVGVPMDPAHGSRLSDGTYLPWHDDWDCVLDLMNAGLVRDSSGANPGTPILLSEKGYLATAALRKHKASGGTFNDCGPVIEKAI